MKTSPEQKDILSEGALYEGIDDDSNLWVDTSQGYPVTVIMPDYGKRLSEPHAAALAMISSKELFYKVDRDRRGKLVFKPTALSKYFRRLNGFLAMHKPDCRFSEPITLLFEWAHKLGLHHEHFTYPGTPSIVPGKTQADLCNELVKAMQREGNTKEFKKRVFAREEKSANNFKSAMAYEGAMFAWRSRLLVMRVDFGYRAEYGKAVPISEAREDLERFLNNRRKNKTLFGRMGGYIWKLEYGAEGKGFHFHVLFFFDGAKAHKDAYRADKIGQYWANSITKGKGNYHNCNRDKRKYRHLGIGMIHRDDVEKRENLRVAIQYLTKKDYCFKPEMDDGRIFGKGAKPPSNTTGVGRPPLNHPKFD